MDFLQREIFEQPRVVERLLSRQKTLAWRLAEIIRQRSPAGILVAARGSSDNAALYGKYLLGMRNGLVVALAAPSMFTKYRRPPRLHGWVVLGISQSGRSDDLCQVLREARRAGCLTVAITNFPQSPLARLASEVFPLEAGPERAVAATKTYTAQLAALALLSTAMRRDKHAMRQLESLPEAMQRVLDSSRQLSGEAQRYRYLEQLAVIGRGYNYCTAYELALKLKELAALGAEPFSSADFRHGPVAMIRPGAAVLAVATAGNCFSDLMALLRELRRRRAELLVIGNRPAALRLAQTPFSLPAQLPEWLSPLLAVLPGQVLALELTRVRGLPTDRPIGLKKVTRTW